MRRTRALDLAVFIIRREIVGTIGLNRDELANARIIHSGAIESDEQGTVAAVEIAGVEGESDALLFLILPVESAVQNFQAEIAVND